MPFFINGHFGRIITTPGFWVRFFVLNFWGYWLLRLIVVGLTLYAFISTMSGLMAADALKAGHIISPEGLLATPYWMTFILYVLCLLGAELSGRAHKRRKMIADQTDRQHFVFDTDYSFQIAMGTLRVYHRLEWKVIDEFFADKFVIKSDDIIRKADRKSAAGIRARHEAQLTILNHIQAMYSQEKKLHSDIMDVLQMQRSKVNDETLYGAVRLIETIDADREDLVQLIEPLQTNRSMP